MENFIPILGIVWLLYVVNTLSPKVRQHLLPFVGAWRWSLILVNQKALLHLKLLLDDGDCGGSQVSWDHFAI